MVHALPRRDQGNSRKAVVFKLIVAVPSAILIGLAFTAVQLATNWWSERPAQMLQRFLQVEEEGITNLQTDYRRGIDFTANIYFESNSETMCG